ncbi:DNA-3-methyladenine glycosylase family protein [Nitrosomonas marina]|nr:DNA-3-methyladenine glycosylase [Nitrosomonas marina]
MPDYWLQATQELAARDAVMRDLIQCFDDVALKSRGDAFCTLARSIVGQQISVKAAESVWQKFQKAMPDITPHAIHAADDGVLRACGLSLRKISYLKDLSHHFREGTFDVSAWDAADDETLIAQLVRIKGIGRWTAEMFLIFHMLRPDVLPLDDIGLQRAICRHYFDNQSVDKQVMRKLAERWQPWRSVATWYLWRSLDPLPVEY